MQRNVHEAAVAVGPDRRQAGDGQWVQHSVPNEAKATGAFGDQHAAVGKERDRPRMREPLRHDADANLVLLGRVDDPRPVTQRRYRYADRRRLGLIELATHEDQQRRSAPNGTSNAHANFPPSRFRREG